MKTSGVLKEINSIYLPGCIVWFGKQPEDKWQQALDLWESKFDFKNEEAQSIANLEYLETVKRLLSEYRANAAPPSKLSPLDAFMIAHPETRRAWESNLHKICVRCDGVDNLTLKRVPEVYDHYWICKECRKVEEHKS